MGAQIVITDGMNPPVLGSVDLSAAALGTEFTASNYNDTGVGAHRWILADRPIGSVAGLSSTTDPTTDITPDVPGTYLIRLRTYADVAATLLDDADLQGIGIRFAGIFDWRVPAAGETTQFNTSRGWATAREEMIRDVYDNLLQPGAVPKYTAGSAGSYTCPAFLVVGDAVRHTTAYSVDRADASLFSTSGAFGVVIAKPTSVTATVAYEGEIVGFSGLTPGRRLYLGVGGGIVEEGSPSMPSLPGHVVLEVGSVIAPNAIIFRPILDPILL